MRPTDSVPTTPGLVAVWLLGLTLALVTCVAWFVDLPTPVLVVAAVLLAAGMVLCAVLAFRAARAAGRSVLRVLWSTAVAPVRFFFDFTF
ncbi:hypothetical protein Cch01nite_42430 [Cellulomonas chitinilytica]|uniref:Uncharacterized protein n=1 Tax=Cellulomonas chitinilytica TaxID=398759 RepID=A0A919P9U3_9CELL|nr:hypothetical protein [Cellulomonas chitinilytica]GIG23519.1 hypothetical protein Cch01nite_42430 [Cellulomonas chitinilytica]